MNPCQGLFRLFFFIIKLSAVHGWKTHTLLIVTFNDPETCNFHFRITDANLFWAYLEFSCPLPQPCHTKLYNDLFLFLLMRMSDSENRGKRQKAVTFLLNSSFYFVYPGPLWTKLDVCAQHPYWLWINLVDRRQWLFLAGGRICRVESDTLQAYSNPSHWSRHIILLQCGLPVFDYFLLLGQRICSGAR